MRSGLRLHAALFSSTSGVPAFPGRWCVMFADNIWFHIAPPVNSNPWAKIHISPSARVRDRWHVYFERLILSNSKNIPEARRKMLSGYSNPTLATARRKRGYSRKIKQPSTLQKSPRAQASFHATPDHGRKNSNRALHIITKPLPHANPVSSQ